jgi:dTDP-4-dehydrorhamnose reductase
VSQSAPTSAQRVLLLGASGQLGRELATVFAHTGLLAFDRSAADLSQPESLRAIVRSVQPQLILNAAAFTAVDRAEEEPELADRINHQSVRVLAEEAQRLDSLLVHYSTDYVFDGSGTAPWAEADAPGPLNTYGRTKLAGERAIAAACTRHLILRTSWVYSQTGHNFLLTMLRLFRERDHLRIVGDQWGAPTAAAALASASHQLVSQALNPALSAHQPPIIADSSIYGLYHATCAGRTSWYGFAQSILERVRALDPSAALANLESIPSDAYPTPARRPLNSVLANTRLNSLGIHLPPWEQALDAVMLAPKAASSKPSPNHG